MSVPKSKRNESKIEFEKLYFTLADNIDNLVEHDFYAKGVLAEKNRKFLDQRGTSLEQLTDSLLFNIKIANSIYPTCQAELDERRVCMGKAIGTCYAILATLQRVMKRLKIPDDKYTSDIENIVRIINSLKAWRKSDNKFKNTFAQQV